MTTDTLHSSTVLVPADRMTEFESRLRRLNERAERFGMRPIEAAPLGKSYYALSRTAAGEGVVAEQLVPVQDGELLSKSRQGVPLVAMNRFALTYPIVKLGQWQVIGLVESLSDDTSKGVVYNLKKDPDNEASLELYRDSAKNCDHCNVKRQRKRSFILQSNQGEIKQVGSTCLTDYTGVDAAEALHLAKMVNVYQEFSDTEEDIFSGTRARVVNTKVYVAACLYSQQKYGFVSTNSNLDIPTYIDALDMINEASHKERRVFFDTLDASMTKVEEVIKECQEDAERSPTSFSRNLASLLKEDVVGLQSNHLKILAGGISTALNRLSQKGAEKSVHVGELKQRMDRTLILKSIFTKSSDFYGPMHIINFNDQAGNRFVWFASNPPDDLMHAMTGQVIEAKFTVAEHIEYEGQAQTKINRLKVLKMAPEEQSERTSEQNETPATVEPGPVKKPAEAMATEEVPAAIGENQQVMAQSYLEVIAKQVRLIIPQMQRFERSFGRSQWPGYIKRLVSGNDVLKAFSNSPGLTGAAVPAKVALSKARESKDLEAMAAKLDVAILKEAAQEVPEQRPEAREEEQVVMDDIIGAPSDGQVSVDCAGQDSATEPESDVLEKYDVARFQLSQIDMFGEPMAAPKPQRQ